MYDMREHLGRDSNSATDVTATHATGRHLTCRVEGLGQNIYGQFHSSLRVFDKLDRLK